MTASSRQPYVYDVCLLGHDGRSTSRNFAYALADYLKTECNLYVFLDFEDVLPGQSVFDVLKAFEKSKFIVAVMCRAFIENRWNDYTAESAFLDRLKTDRFIPLYVLDVRKQDINNIQEIKKYNVTSSLHFGDAKLPKDNLEALDKLRRALTAGISQPEQDARNNEGQGDESNEEISQPQVESAPPYEVIYSRDDVTGNQPPPLLQGQSGRVECQQEGMKTQDGTWQTGDEGPDGPHLSDETVEGELQLGPSSLSHNALPSQDSPPLLAPPPPPPTTTTTTLAPPPPPPPPTTTTTTTTLAPPPPLALVGTGLDSGFANAPSSSPPTAWYSPLSPVPQTQSEVFQGPNREDSDCVATGEETSEGGQGQDAVEDASGENSVRSWMGSLSSFLRDVAPVFWTCILYTENSTPQLFPM